MLRDTQKGVEGIAVGAEYRKAVGVGITEPRPYLGVVDVIDRTDGVAEQHGFSARAHDLGGAM